jgi:hypothetical protein
MNEALSVAGNAAVVKPVTVVMITRKSATRPSVPETMRLDLRGATAEAQYAESGITSVV